VTPRRPRDPDPAVLAKQESIAHHQPPGGTAVLGKHAAPSIDPTPSIANVLAKQQDLPDGAAPSTPVLDKHAQRVALGKARAKTLTPAERQKGGRRGGEARANALAPDVRKRIARDAALVRWGKL
jgi:hypothetical protein